MDLSFLHNDYEVARPLTLGQQYVVNRYGRQHGIEMEGYPSVTNVYLSALTRSNQRRVHFKRYSPQKALSFLGEIRCHPLVDGVVDIFADDDFIAEPMLLPFCEAVMEDALDQKFSGGLKYQLFKVSDDELRSFAKGEDIYLGKHTRVCSYGDVLIPLKHALIELEAFST